jgi:hypothetical protein
MKYKSLMGEEHEVRHFSSTLTALYKMFSVAQKLSTIIEQRQDQSCLFQQGDFRNKGQNPEKKLSWVRVPVKVFSVP